MKYLLDTHVFLWLDHKPKQLSERVKTIIADGQNSLYLSIVSVWEIQIKVQLGKLEIPALLPDIVSSQITANQIELLPVTLQHIFGLSTLPTYHKDPFDRLLITQALSEEMVFISDDSQVSRYPVASIW